MKINRFSPLQQARIDIAGFTLRVLREPTALANLTLWTESEDFDPEFAEFAEVRTFDARRRPYEEFATGACVYNLGVDHRFYGAIWRMSLSVTCRAPISKEGPQSQAIVRPYGR
jgi:hypothetical protein